MEESWELNRRQGWRVAVGDALVEAGDPDAAVQVAFEEPDDPVGGWHEVLVKAAQAQAGSGRREVALQTLDRALHRAQTSSDSTARFHGPLFIAMAQAELGDAQAAIRTAAGISDARQHAYALGRVGQRIALAGDPPEALRIAQQLPQGQDQADLLAAVAVGEARVGNRQAAAAMMGRVLKIVDEVQALHRYTLYRPVELLARAGDVELALRSAARIKDAEVRDFARSGVSQAQARAGDSSGAILTARRIPQKRWAASALGQIAMILADRGDAPQSRAVFREAVAHAVEADRERRQPGSSLWGISDLQVRAGQAGDAIHTVARAKPGAEKATALVRLAPEVVGAGDHAAAQRLLRQGLSMGERLPAGPRREGFLVMAAKSRAELGDVAGAMTTVQQFGRSGRSLLRRADALLWIARAQNRSGDRQGARAALVEAMVTLTPIGEGWIENRDKLGTLSRVAVALVEAGDTQEARAVARTVGREYGTIRCVAKTEALVGDAQGAAVWAQGVSDPIERAEILVGAAQGLAELERRSGWRPSC